MALAFRPDRRWTISSAAGEFLDFGSQSNSETAVRPLRVKAAKRANFVATVAQSKKYSSALINYAHLEHANDAVALADLELGSRLHGVGGDMRLAHFGTFDVQNYGDLLFPLIVENKLAGLAHEIVHISPLGGPQVYRDVPASVSFESVRKTKFDGVVVGGGNILHSAWTNLPDYDTVKYTAYLSLWTDASRLAREQNIPLVTNAPGVPYSFPWPATRLIRELSSRATYMSVRDAYSRERISRAGATNVAIVPDSALQLSDVLGISTSFNDPFVGELAPLNEGPYIAVHVNGRYASQSLPELASMLDELSSEKSAQICLIGIGPCHGDDVLARELGSQMKSRPLIFANPESVGSIAKVIAGARFYVGSSLHGFITASSFGTSAFLVASHKKQSKFLGLLSQINSSDRMVGSWSEALELITRSPAGVDLQSTAPDLRNARTDLDLHWSAIRDALSDASPAPRRNRILRILVRFVIVRNFLEAKARQAARGVLNRLGRS
jgi:hypothetical protein